MSSISESMNSPAPTDPRRLSALYQYHNAPEVAPAHGLEFDDNLYPHSDKYPVVHERPTYDASYTGKHAFANDNRPPRIIFGMKVRTFMVVAAAMLLVIIGAAVGGAVGGSSLRGTQTVDMSSNSTSTTPSATASPTTTSTFSAPTPTYTPLRDCPASNNTTYTSSYAPATSNSTSQTFTKYCDLASPLSVSAAHMLAEAFVYSFSDCVEVCAGHNAVNSGSGSNSNCSAAVYQSSAGRPGNCWVGFAGSNAAASALQGQQGQDVALLLAPSSS